MPLVVLPSKRTRNGSPRGSRASYNRFSTLEREDYGDKPLPRSRSPRKVGHRRKGDSRSRRRQYSRSRRREAFRPTQRATPRPARGAESRNQRSTHSIPAAFFPLTKEHFAILKSHHHLNCLNEGLPPSLQRRIDGLKDSINPAFKSDFFVASLDSATSDWHDTILRSLRDHYEGIMNDAFNYISSTPMPAAILDASLQLVFKWARSQLGRKLFDTELDEAMSLICEHQLVEDEQQEPPSAPAFQPRPPASYSQGTQTDLPTQRHKCVSPAPAAKTTTTPLKPVDSSRDITPPPPSPVVPALEAPAPSQPVPPEPRSPDPRPSAFRQTKLLSADTFTLEPDGHPPPSNEVLRSCKRSLLLGDASISSLKLENCTIVSANKGRLRFFKQWLQSSSTIREDVLDLVLCLPLLDANNKPATNFSTLRTLLYHARRILPNARLSVVPALSMACSQADLGNMQELWDLISSKRPVDCEPLSLPTAFTSDTSAEDAQRQLEQTLQEYFL